MITQFRLLELAATAALDEWRYWDAECESFPGDENAQRNLERAKQEYDEIRKTLLRGGYFDLKK